MIGDKAFVALRNKLNCLHYCQPLSHDSCSLVERVLGDLLATTELYQRTKLRAEEAENQITHEQIALMPLKKDNARVVRENNALHKEIIQVKENLSQNDNSWQRQYKQIESEYNDIKQAFLAKNYKIKEMEKRNLKLEERLGRIMTKAYKPDVKQIESAMMPNGEPNDIGKCV
jgi:centrosomal protein CEP135